MISAQEYTNNLLNALNIYINNNNGYGLYEGIEGSLRLAREYGYGLKDYSEKERLSMTHSSYGSLCVRFYNLKPPIDAKIWIAEINKIINKNNKEEAKDE